MRLPVNYAMPLAALVLLSACGGGGAKPAIEPDPVGYNGPSSDYPVVVGAPFTIDGTTYTPVDKLNFDEVGYAVAGGEGAGITIAHKTLPLPSYAEVTSLESGKTVLVRVERRGPMVNDRLVELSPGAAAQLGLTGNTKAPIRIRRVNPPEMERSMLRGGRPASSRMDTPPSLLTVLKRKLDPQLVVPPAPMPDPSASASSAPIASPTPRPPTGTAPGTKPSRHANSPRNAHAARDPDPARNANAQGNAYTPRDANPKAALRRQRQRPPRVRGQPRRPSPVRAPHRAPLLHPWQAAASSSRSAPMPMPAMPVRRSASWAEACAAAELCRASSWGPSPAAPQPKRRWQGRGAQAIRTPESSALTDPTAPEHHPGAGARV